MHLFITAGLIIERKERFFLLKDWQGVCKVDGKAGKETAGPWVIQGKAPLLS